MFNLFSRKKQPRITAKDLQRDDYYKKKYDLSLVEYAKLFKIQKGVCATCGNRTKVNLYVDHDHQTGKVRGLLCLRCNLGIGYFQDNPKALLSAATYLKPNKNLIWYPIIIAAILIAYGFRSHIAGGIMRSIVKIKNRLPGRRRKEIE